MEKSFPELVKRVAIGRIFGSDVIGADDELSKDHNWGPQFTIFLSAEDYAEQGEKLSEVMNKVYILGIKPRCHTIDPELPQRLQHGQLILA